MTVLESELRREELEVLALQEGNALLLKQTAAVQAKIRLLRAKKAKEDNLPPVVPAPPPREPTPPPREPTPPPEEEEKTQKTPKRPVRKIATKDDIPSPWLRPPKSTIISAPQSEAEEEEEPLPPQIPQLKGYVKGVTNSHLHLATVI